MFQMVKFSIIVKQITGTQAWLPENPTDHGQKPLCLRGNQRQRTGVQDPILQLSQPRSCLSLCVQLFASFTWPLLTAAQPESCYPLGDAPLVPSWPGRSLAHPVTINSILGHSPRRTDEPGILSTWLCKLTDGIGLATGERR